MFERALVFMGSEGPNEAVLPVLEHLVPGTATVFELRTIPARAGWSEPPRMGGSRSRAPDPASHGVGSSRRILKRTADPARSILEIVDELGIDLVALDAAPAGGLRRFRAPDVAHRVIDSGRVPVLLVGKEYVPQAPNLRRLLLPFDPFVPSRPLLEMASQVSRRAQAEVVVLGFIPIPVQPEDQGIVFADEPLHRVTPEARISDFARDLAALGCRVRSLHAYEEPLEAIPRYARSLDVDMILMGKTGWGQGGRSMFDGMSHQLAVSLECPLLFGGSAWRGRRRAPLAG